MSANVESGDQSIIVIVTRVIRRIVFQFLLSRFQIVCVSQSARRGVSVFLVKSSAQGQFTTV